MTDETLENIIPAVEEKREEFLRFSLVFRIQHIFMFLSVIALIITGLPLKYHDTALAQWYFQSIGGVPVSGIIHRIAAAVLIGVGAFHMYYVIFMREGRHHLKEMLPKFKDVADVTRNVFYFLGFLKDRPRFGRFSYIEKFDYWAVYWGMVIMIGTGLMLWFTNLTLSFIPKAFLDAAKEAHSDEALLATLAIVVWHFYNVHFNPSKFPMSMAWLTGKISKEEMLHEHPLEYEKLMAEEEAKRQAELAFKKELVGELEEEAEPEEEAQE